MKRGTKIALTVGVLAALGLAFAGAANADDLQPDDDDDDDGEDPLIPGVVVDPNSLPCPPGQVRVNGVCVVPPPPPDKKLCNYVGCGPAFNWSHKDRFPNERSFGQALEQIGYIFSPHWGAASWSIISAQSMGVVRQFQRDYNVARLAQTVEPTPNGLATDGLVGNNTINAIIKAQNWVNVLGLSWADIVALG